MIEDGGINTALGQDSICILLSISCEGKLSLILFPDRIENVCTHQLSCCRPHPKAALFCVCKDTTSDKGPDIGAASVILQDTYEFFSDKTDELGLYQRHQFCTFLVLMKNTNLYNSTRMKYFLLPTLAGVEWHFRLSPCVHNT